MIFNSEFKLAAALVGAIALMAMLASCGSMSRSVASFTGHSEVCVDGNVYLQFPSGVTPKIARDHRSYVPC